MDALLEALRSEIIEIVKDLRTEDGVIKTDIPSLNFYSSQTTTELATVIYEPSLCLILQGSKAVVLGDNTYCYDSTKYLLASVHMPSRSRIMEASEEEPYISLRLTFTLEDIFDVIKEMPQRTYGISPSPELGLCFGDLTTTLLDALARSVRLLRTPQNIKFMAPMIKKEILYMVMNDAGGDFLRKYVIDGSITQQIVKVIAKIKNDFTENLNMRELAKMYGMSESSLYFNFKKVTLLSPLQFQKTIRLEEARRILVTQNIEASEVAFAVGYESPSQFSREYARMFGLPPKTYVKNMHDGIEDHIR